METLGNGLLWIGSLFVWIGGGFFNKAVEINLAIANQLETLPIVSLGWAIFRDLANMGFIFILVYISINTILGNNEYHIKKTIGMIIVAAVAVNFSMFATKAVIDLANIPTAEIYKSILSSDSTDIDRGLSERLMGMFHLSSIYKPSGLAGSSESGNAQQLAKKAGADTSSWNIFLIGLFGMVFLMIGGFIFLTAGFMFLARFINFIFLILLSPLAFASLALGKTSKHFGTWLDTLLAQAFFAPVFLLLVLIIINGMEKSLTSGGASFVDILAKKDTDAFGVLVNFFLLSGFLIGALYVAKMVSSSGSQTIMSYANKASSYFNNKGIGAAKGLAFRGTRLVAGGGAGAIAKTLRNRNVGSGFAGRLALKTLDNVAGGKYGTKESYAENTKKIRDRELTYTKTLSDKAKKEYENTGYTGVSYSGRGGGILKFVANPLSRGGKKAAESRSSSLKEGRVVGEHIRNLERIKSSLLKYQNSDDKNIANDADADIKDLTERIEKLKTNKAKIDDEKYYNKESMQSEIDKQMETNNGSDIIEHMKGKIDSYRTRNKSYIDSQETNRNTTQQRQDRLRRGNRPRNLR